MTMNEMNPADQKQENVPYGGYQQTQIPEYDPTLTETGPGTQAGEYLRRFWHPVCMVEELTDVPRFLMIMGEELVAFRDGSGQIGVLHAHCAHRTLSSSPPRRASDLEDGQAAALNDRAEAACEACGTLGEWKWMGADSQRTVARNGGWGLLRAPPEPNRRSERLGERLSRAGPPRRGIEALRQ